MNESDSENISGLLHGMGAIPTERIDTADLVIINTCAVRKKSEDKLYSLLGRLQSQKKRAVFIGVTGCVAQLHRSRLLDKFPGIDLIIGPHNYHKLPEILTTRLKDKTIATDWDRRWHELPLISTMRGSQSSAYVTIMEGCDNFCSYCVVPYTRGREKFRSQSNILDEIQSLAYNHYKEVQLLGQNVNSYQDPVSGGSFSDLLKKACLIEGIEWIRFITSHPKNFSEEIARTMKTENKICRQLHLPLQSGSTSVLERMNRGYSREDYLKIIDLLHGLMPDIYLSTDIIVGFPGETDEEFSETLDILEKIKFTNIFSFRYSPRPLTAASKLEDSVPFDTKRNRLLAVQKQQKEIQMAANRSLVGKTIRVLCSGSSKKDSRVLMGRTEGFQVVNFTSDKDVIGQFVNIRITDYGPFSLRGTAVEEKATG
jgi:tRNA-2-methylthio-N6-dimethylallyladenosine synthase